jgi:MinD-like ATPase involved in chromosome partitioning or flagellar assembly
MPASQTSAPAPAVPVSPPPAEPVPPAPQALPAEPVPPATPPPVTAAPAPVAAKFVSVERERRLPSIERALSGPGSRGEVSWRRQVKVVAGGQGPGKRDPETLDRDRARLPLVGPRRIAVLGCTRGAGQTVTTLMTGHVLAAARGAAVAALDLNPGATSLAARRVPAASVQALLAGWEPGPQAGRGSGARLDVIADPPGTGAAQAGGHDIQRLADLLAERYPLTMIDPAPSGLTRVLIAADQLVLVAPASPDAATALANTQQWLGAHGYGELVSRAVMVVNGVSRRTMEDVLRAESVARGRCRAIVRVPWDDLLSMRSGSPSTRPVQTALHPQTRLAYTALAGVLVAGLAANPSSPVSGRNPGEHAD